VQGTDNATMLLGRVLLSLLFLIGGTAKLLGPAATQAMFVKQGLPMVEAAWILAVVVELGGGLAMLFGLLTRPVGLVLAIWCVATA
jgi:putative oxidoreductase